MLSTWRHQGLTTSLSTNPRESSQTPSSIAVLHTHTTLLPTRINGTGIPGELLWHLVQTVCVSSAPLTTSAVSVQWIRFAGCLSVELLASCLLSSILFSKEASSAAS